MWVRSLKEGMATHSVFLPGESAWTEEPGGYSPLGRKEWDTTEATWHARMQPKQSLANFSSPSNTYLRNNIIIKSTVVKQIWSKIPILPS